jgi:uncharacterized protein YgbK (DUF1537 family)
MLELAIVADDMTGALDAGVQCTNRGFVTMLGIVQEGQALFPPPDDCEVLAINAESRHLEPAEAASRIGQIVSAVKEFAPGCLLVKTDSGLRGPIGESLVAAYTAFGQSHLAFVPSFPQLDRVCRGGRYYVGGVPVRESVFANDPLNPVSVEKVEELFPAGSPVECRMADGPMEGIGIYDCESQEQMERLANRLFSAGVRAYAGCAGIADALASLLGKGRKPRQPVRSEKSTRPLFVVCGSLNRITAEQLDFAEANGMVRFTLEPEQIFEQKIPFLDAIVDALSHGKDVALDSGISARERMQEYMEVHGVDRAEAAERVSHVLGMIVGGVRECGLLPYCRLMVVGGDTLSSVLVRLHGRLLVPLREPERGVVVSRLHTTDGTIDLISKSGGFGTRNTLKELMK